MHILNIAIGWLLCLSVCAQVSNPYSNNTKTKKDINFTGEWRFELQNPQNPQFNESFVLNIYQENNKYVGNYCRIIQNGLKKDCSDSQNLTLTPEGEKLQVLLLSQWGGFVRGELVIKDIHTLTWIRRQEIGDSFTPKQVDLVGNNNLFSESEIYLLPPFNEKSLGDYKKHRLIDTKLKPNINTSLNNSHFIADIKSNIPRINVFLFSDCSPKNDCQRYLLVTNPEGNIIDQLQLIDYKDDFKSENGNYQKIIDYKIDKDFSINLLVETYHKNKLKSSDWKEYKINTQGKVEDLNPPTENKKPKKFKLF